MKKFAYAVQDQETIGKWIEGRRSGHALEVCCGSLQRDPRRQNLAAQAARVASCGRSGGETLDPGGDRLQRRTQSVLHLPRIVVVELPETDEQTARNGKYDQEFTNNATEVLFIGAQFRRLEQSRSAQRVERNHFRHHLLA